MNGAFSQLQRCLLQQNNGSTVFVRLSLQALALPAFKSWKGRDLNLHVMQIDVGIYIADLLFEHERVVIPGLGGFTTAYQPAEIDQVQRRMNPPGKTLAFNPNLVVNDGLLVNYLRERCELSLPEAQRAVDSFVQGVQEAIARSEVVVFPKVGRLYQDFEQKLQFLPDETNFNVDSYGLPAVEFFPIIARPSATPEKGRVPVTKNQAQPAKKQGDWAFVVSDWFQRWLPLIGILTIILVVLGVVFTLRKDEPVTPPNEEIPSGRINVKPSLEEVPEAGAGAPQSGAQEGMTGTPAIPGDTEGSTILPGQKYAIILIGLFGNQNNINKLSEKLYKAGFEPYTEQAGNLTRVGVIIAYDDEAEVERALADVRKNFDARAFVHRRDVEK